MTDDILISDRSGDPRMGKLSINRSAVIRPVGAEALAWSPSCEFPAFLDPIAALLLSAFDGEATAEDLIADVEAALEVPREIASAQVTRVVNLLANFGLLGGQPTNDVAIAADDFLRHAGDP